VATIRSLLKITGLFCRISSLLQGSFAKETYNFKEPTHRSHPIFVRTHTHTHTRRHTHAHTPQIASHSNCTYSLHLTTTHCNTLKHTATHGNTLQHTTVFTYTHAPMKRSSSNKYSLRHTATHCNTLQHTATMGEGIHVPQIAVTQVQFRERTAVAISQKSDR